MLVSIITPSYNQGKYIEATIKSVLMQTYNDVEYIIIDGGSNDNTLEILKSYEKKLYWVSEPDRGQTHAINKGIKMSKGEIIGWLNSDDLYLPNAIEIVVNYFRIYHEVGLIYGKCQNIDTNGVFMKEYKHYEGFNLNRLLNVNSGMLPQQSAFFRKQLVDKIGFLDEELNYGMDYDYWIRIAKFSKVLNINETLGQFRTHSDSKTCTNSLKMWKEVLMISRKHGGRRFSPLFFKYLIWRLRQPLRPVKHRIKKLFNL
jgi:glycosyltransferase involved in cell wall biosynthesis